MVTALRIGGGFINHPRWVSTLHTKTNIVKVWKGHKYAICLECSLSVFLKVWKPDTTRLLPRSPVIMRVLYRQKDALRTYLPSCQMNNVVLATLRAQCMKTADGPAYGYAEVILPDLQSIMLLKNSSVCTFARQWSRVCPAGVLRAIP